MLSVLRVMFVVSARRLPTSLVILESTFLNRVSRSVSSSTLSTAKVGPAAPVPSSLRGPLCCVGGSYIFAFASEVELLSGDFQFA